MAEFRKLSADDVREILDAFEGLGAAAYRSHAPVAAGTINTNVRVETAAGLVFLRINEGKTRDDVAREAAIIAHVAARGVPTPSPRLTHAGEAVAVWRSELASVFPWVPGRTLSRAEVTPAHAGLVGRALAMLHLASGGYADRRPGRYEPDEIRRRAAHVASLQRAELIGPGSVLTRALDGLESARAATLPAGIIHGDLFIDNVLYDDPRAGEGPPRLATDSQPRLAALLDFEQASWGRFAYDLAVTTLAFAYGRADFRADVTRALLEHYAAARPPTDDERRAFSDELRFAACRFAVTRITDVHLKRDAGAPVGKDFRRYLARLASVEAHLATGDGLLELP
jgi:homoserine kinase type II